MCAVLPFWEGEGVTNSTGLSTGKWDKGDDTNILLCVVDNDLAIRGYLRPPLLKLETVTLLKR